MGECTATNYLITFLSMEYPYFKTIPDPQDPTKMIQELASLAIETRIAPFSDNPEVNNPTGDENAFFYGITIDG